MTLSRALGQPEPRRGLDDRSVHAAVAVVLFAYVLVLRTAR